MTSNVGARLITEKARPSLGFANAEETADRDYEHIKSQVLGELKNVFRPELINRIDEIIVFHKLTREDIEKITSVMLGSLKNRMEALGHEIEFTDSLISHLADAGYDEMYGARPLRRAIQSEVEDFLADNILSGNVLEGKKVTVDYDGEKVNIKEPANA